MIDPNDTDVVVVEVTFFGFGLGAEKNNRVFVTC